MLTNNALDPSCRVPEFKACAVRIEEDRGAKHNMAKKGDMLYAWTNDADIKKKAELGGAVTAIWKHALESKVVDAVLTIKKGTDLYRCPARAYH